MEFSPITATGPLYLLSDSQLLFAREDRAFLPQVVARYLSGNQTLAAYVGASNGDEPAFYEIFKAAMNGVGITRTHLVSKHFRKADQQCLEAAGLVLLAGGDVAMGWQTMLETGMAEVLRKLMTKGIVVIGVSAGSVQLGCQGWHESTDGERQRFPTFGVVPLIVDCHDEAQDWRALETMVARGNGEFPGLGIPFGAGLVVDPGGGMCPLGKPLVKMDLAGSPQLPRRTLIEPGKRYDWEGTVQNRVQE